MFETTVRQLQHTDPDVRRRAITALADSRSLDALRPLATIYRRDPVPELRELALKAGQYIQRYAAPATSLTDDLPFDVDTPVTERDKELARGYVNAATEFHMGGDEARAIENLGKALSIHPGLLKHEFVTNLIMSTTGMSVKQAAPLLVHPDRRQDLIAKTGGKRKLKKGQQHGPGAHTATWENVGKDFGLYWLATTMGMLAILLFMLSMIQDLLNNASLASSSTVAEDVDVLMGANVLVLVIAAVFFGIYYVVSLLLQGVFIHLAASFVLGGDGTLVYLFRRLVPFQTAIIMATAGVFMVFGLLADVQGLLLLVGLGTTVGSLYVSYLYSKLISDVYAFGVWSGCGAIVIGGIIQSVVFYIGNYAVLALLGLLFGSAS